MADAIKAVAWMGGSYSPPTKAHFDVALKIGDFLVGKFGGEVHVVIVPVSEAYNKPSVKPSCILSDERKALIQAMVDELNASTSKPAGVTFVLGAHEIDKKDSPTPTIDSLAVLKENYGESVPIFIGQGQDNIMAILKRGWVKSDELLKYGFLMYPRGDGTTKDALTSEMRIALGAVSTKGFPAVNDGSEQDKIIDRIHVLSVPFNDDTSSTGVRSAIKNGTDYESMMTPDVYSKLQELIETRPTLYKEGCDTAGGRRKRKTRHNKSRKVKKTKKNKRKQN